MIALGDNQYGKSRVRLMKVERDDGQHCVFEWNVEVWMIGDFRDCFLKGDNSLILPTDTMKNTVYSLARRSSARTIEEFATELAAYFLASQPQINATGAHISSVNWRPIETYAGTHKAAFIQAGPEIETATVTQARDGAVKVLSGMDQTPILKTAQSAFTGFKRDNLTTLKQTDDRLLGTVMKAEWTHNNPISKFDAVRARVRESLLATFGGHDSKSIQQTLYAMGEAALLAAPEISAIHISMPNKHYNLADLAPFGQDNPNHIFIPTDEPHGAIQATVRRVN